ncbi:MAG: DUF2190 family protein [Solirubrobacterales bacterium]
MPIKTGPFVPPQTPSIDQVGVGLFVQNGAQSGAPTLVGLVPSSAIPSAQDVFGAIIYKPGTPSTADHVATWPEVQAFIGVTDGKCIVYVDDSIVSPALVPGATGLTNGLGRVEIRPYREDFFNFTTLVVQDGATLKGLFRLAGTIDLLSDCKSATPSFDWDYTPNVVGTPEPMFFVQEAATIGTTATATHPAMVIPPASLFTLQLDTNGAVFVQGASPLVRVSAGAVFTGNLFGAFLLGLASGPIPATWVDGPGQSMLQFDSATLGFSPSAVFPQGSNSPPPSSAAVAVTNLVDRSPQRDGVVNFVFDCGADPSGAADCAAAWEVARTLLTQLSTNPELPATTLTLFFPPGIYAQNSALLNPVWNFLNKGTALRVMGAGQDASIIQFNGFDGPVFANLFRFSMSDLAVTGIKVPFNPDSGTCFEIAVSNEGVIERCTFNSMQTTSGVLFLLGESWTIRDCSFTDVSCTDVTRGVVYSIASYIAVENSIFFDISALNGYPNVLKTSTNGTWLRQKDTPVGPGSGSQQRGVCVRGCVFDESCSSGVAVVGGPTGNVPYVKIEACAFNPPILGAKDGCVVLTNVDVAVIDGMIDSADLASNPTTPTIAMTAVGSARIRALTIGPGLSNFLTADAACKYLRIEDSPTLLPAGIFDGTAARCLTKTIELETFGTDTEVEAWPVLVLPTVFVGAVVKLTTASVYGPVAVTDGVGLATGVALDAGSGAAAKPGRIARRGEIVTVLSDGTTAIAIGDPITNLGANATGRVLKATATGTTPILGIAVSAAGAGGGPVLFDMIFETGEA